jgi:hypothetical protein
VVVVKENASKFYTCVNQKTRMAKLRLMNVATSVSCVFGSGGRNCVSRRNSRPSHHVQQHTRITSEIYPCIIPDGFTMLQSVEGFCFPYSFFLFCYGRNLYGIYELRCNLVYSIRRSAIHVSLRLPRLLEPIM